MGQKEYIFEKEEQLIEKLKELVKKDKVTDDDVTIYSPYHLHDVDEILGASKSPLKFFTLLGTISGVSTGFLLTNYTVWAWPIITAGKPIHSQPPFIVICFELFILLGALFSFAGFLFLSRLPNPKNTAPEKDYGNEFVIVVNKE